MENLTKKFILPFLLITSCAAPHREIIKRRTKQGVYHPVRRGETLWRISRTYGISLKKLQDINRIKDPNDIKVGDRILIPGAKWTRRIKAISPSMVAGKKRVLKKRPSRRKRKRAPPRSRHKKRKTKPAKTKPVFIWPVKGVITSRFGYRKKGQRHDGIDIAAPKGAPVYAAKSGKVIYSDDQLRYYGNTIILKHSGSWFTVYAHNSKHFVTLGQRVKKGGKIAEVGDSGRAKGYHLHFEVRKKDKSVNPLLYLPN